eukprot:11448086-Alexandrium_andersonii.AAC.1
MCIRDRRCPPTLACEFPARSAELFRHQRCRAPVQPAPARPAPGQPGTSAAGTWAAGHQCSRRKCSPHQRSRAPAPPA